ncbi:MAG: tetratricopeptide repeat protein [Labilithrix sp.]|nr:tetratricopeptide repeat protein [Labilithrix sp.]
MKIDSSLLRPLFVSATVVALACLVARPARADDDPRKKAAETTFQEGVRLHGQGKHEEALAKLRQAYETYPSPNTLTGIARVEQALGRELQALRHYREAIRNPLTHPENADRSRAAVKELETKLARVDIKGPAGLTIVVDGARYVLPLVEPLDVQPDTFVVEGTLGETRYQGRATAVVGRVTEIELRADALPPAAASASPSTVAPLERESSFWDAGRIVGLAAFGVGIASIGAGAFFGGESNDAAARASDLQTRLGRDGCAASPPPVGCVELRDARDAQSRDATLSTVFIVTGVLASAAGAALFVWPRSNVRVTPAAGGGAALHLVGSF